MSFDLSYDELGKPHLKDGKHISITLSVLCNNHQRPDGRYRYQLQREK
jgi:hypothetical protein